MSNEKDSTKNLNKHITLLSKRKNYEEALKRAEILCLLNPQSVEFHHKGLLMPI